MNVSSLPKSISQSLIPTRLFDLYLVEKKSVAEIAKILNCSQNKINYWLKKFEIPKRSLSEAMYCFKNPLGDPFALRQPKSFEEAILFGLGLGIYWGEGDKRGKNGIRLSNTDPRLIKSFIRFLKTFLGIDKNRLKFSIQIFSDISPLESLKYWMKELKMKKEQFYKPQVIKVRGKGIYKYKSKYGVIIVYFNNIKLKKLICEMIENFH